MAEETKESKPRLTSRGQPVMPLQLCQILRNFATESKQMQREQCGLVVRETEAHQAALCEIENVSALPNEFNMNQEQLLAVYQDNYEIVGCWHTHWQDDPHPSDVDYEHAPSGLRYWIATVHGVWEYDMSGAQPELVHQWKPYN